MTPFSSFEITPLREFSAVLAFSSCRSVLMAISDALHDRYIYFRRRRFENAATARHLPFHYIMDWPYVITLANKCTTTRYTTATAALCFPALRSSDFDIFAPSI
jgi:hypothetical protein